MLDTQSNERLIAVMDRLIPSDPDWPSASQNGVLDYLNYQLAGDLAGYREWLTVGLDQLDSECQKRSGKPFVSLSSNEQHAVILALESGDVQLGWPISPQEFMSRLTEWVAEGYYANPEHNHGNPDKISWKMIGFDERK